MGLTLPTNRSRRARDALKRSVFLRRWREAPPSRSAAWPPSFELANAPAGPAGAVGHLEARSCREKCSRGESEVATLVVLLRCAMETMRSTWLSARRSARGVPCRLLYDGAAV